MILREPIQLEPRETVHIQVNYIGLFKRRSFIMITTYLAVVYTVLDNNIPRIAILMNLTKKRLEFSKNIRLEIIYKCIDIVYIITDITKAFVVVATASSMFSDLFSTV